MRVALTLVLLTVVGGTERLMLDMYRALKDLDHEVDLYAAYLSERAREVAKGFSYERFKERLNEVIRSPSLNLSAK
jgi:hypothetical protein